MKIPFLRHLMAAAIAFGAAVAVSGCTTTEMGGSAAGAAAAYVIGPAVGINPTAAAVVGSVVGGVAGRLLDRPSKGLITLDESRRQGFKCPRVYAERSLLARESTLYVDIRECEPTEGGTFGPRGGAEEVRERDYFPPAPPPYAPQWNTRPVAVPVYVPVQRRDWEHDRYRHRRDGDDRPQRQPPSPPAAPPAGEAARPTNPVPAKPGTGEGPRVVY